MQHLAGHESHHRRAMEKRQIRRVVTTVVTERETTFTSVFTTRAPLIPLPTAIFGDDEDEDEETTTTRSSARPSSTSSTPRARPSSSAPTSRPTSASSSISSSIVPSSSSSSVITNRPVQSTSDTTPQSIVISVVNETKTPSPSPSSTDLSANDPVGAKSTGQIVGIAVGVVAGVIGVAIFAAFIVRHMRKRANDKEAWSAAKFRQSALMLNDDNNHNGGGGPAKRGPRPPSMIERRGAANTGSIAGSPPAPSRAYPYTDAPSGFNPQDQLGYNRVATPHQPQQYGAPNPYGAAPMAYSGQNMYGQGADRGYGMGMNPGYGAAAGYGHAQQGMDGMMDMHHPGFPSRGQNGHNSLPPFAAYAPRHEIDGHAFGPSGAATAAGGMMQRNNTAASNLPNPFAERAPAPAAIQSPASSRDSGTSGRGSSESGHVQSNQPRYMTRNGDEDDAQDSREAPPAYTDDGSYAKMQRDVKTPVVMSVEGTKAPSAAPVPAGTPAPATTMGNNKVRPMSSHTVYDPSDAYGGM